MPHLSQRTQTYFEQLLAAVCCHTHSYIHKTNDNLWQAVCVGKQLRLCVFMTFIRFVALYAFNLQQLGWSAAALSSSVLSFLIYTLPAIVCQDSAACLFTFSTFYSIFTSLLQFLVVVLVVLRSIVITVAVQITLLSA